jgi:hypothetical protein
VTEDDLRERFGVTEPCCESCHEDRDTGHGDDLVIEIDGEEVWACCAVARGVDAAREKLRRPCRDQYGDLPRQG